MNQLCLIVVAMLLSSCASAQNKSEDARRLAVVKEYTDAAKFVAEKTRNSQAQWLNANLLNYVRPLRFYSTTIEEIPQGKGFRVPISILALLQSDRQKKDLPPLFVQHLDPKTGVAASFIQTKGTIIVVERSESSLVKGMTLLHEAAHAANFMTSGKPIPKEEQEDPMEETKVHMLEDDLWKLIGGQVYENLIKQEVVRLRAEFKKSGFKGFKEVQIKGQVAGFTLPPPYPYEELKTLVVQSTSKSDMEARQSVLMRSALFRIVEEDIGIKSYADQGNLVKVALIQYLYRLGGIYAR